MRAMDRSCSCQPSHFHPPDHLRQGTLDLQSVRFLVLDEADEMLDREFARDVGAILGRPADGAALRHDARVAGGKRGAKGTRTSKGEGTGRRKTG